MSTSQTREIPKNQSKPENYAGSMPKKFQLKRSILGCRATVTQKLKKCSVSSRNTKKPKMRTDPLKTIARVTWHQPRCPPPLKSVVRLNLKKGLCQKSGNGLKQISRNSTLLLNSTKTTSSEIKSSPSTWKT